MPPKSKLGKKELAGTGAEPQTGFRNDYAKRPIQKTKNVRSNGVRYLRVGGTRERHFAGTNLKPHKPLENAATPTRRVHAVLGCFDFFATDTFFIHDSKRTYTQLRQ